MPSAPHADSGSSKRSAYYWASGHRVALEPSDQVALDLERAERSGLEPKHLEAIRRRGRSVSDSLVILDDKVDQVERAELDAAAALQPVYESSDGTRIIVLPEIRVDVDDSDHGRSLLDAVPSSDLGAELSEQRPGRYLIKLYAGTDNDALDLANNLVETIHPELAQARFVRVVKRPLAGRLCERAGRPPTGRWPWSR